MASNRLYGLRMKSKKIVIRTDEATIALLKSAAKAEGRSMANMVRYAAVACAKRILRAKGLPIPSLAEPKEAPSEVPEGNPPADSGKSE